MMFSKDLEKLDAKGKDVPEVSEDSDGEASVATTPRASGEWDVDESDSIDGETLGLRLRVAPKLEFSGVWRTGTSSSESYYTKYKSKDYGDDYAKYEEFNVNKLDSNKDKLCALEDDFLVATGLVDNECGGGNDDCADSKVLKKAQDQDLPARGQVRHWPPLLVGECEVARRPGFQSFGQSRGEPLPVGFSPGPTSAPTVSTDVFSDVAPIGVLAERVCAAGARKSTTASASTPRCDYKNGEFTRVLGAVLLFY